VPEAPFEVDGDVFFPTSGAPRRARLARAGGAPGPLAQCTVLVAESAEAMAEPSADVVAALVEASGGRAVRVPDLAQQNSAAAATALARIVQQLPPRDEVLLLVDAAAPPSPRRRLEAACGVRAHTVDWLLDSLSVYERLPLDSQYLAGSSQEEDQQHDDRPEDDIDDGLTLAPLPSPDRASQSTQQL
jgi:hypothetical protein